MEPQTQQEIPGHISRLIILLIVFVILAGIATWWGLRQNVVPELPPVQNIVKPEQVKPLSLNSNDSVDVKKSSIVNRAEKASTVPLTVDERNAILTELGPKNISQYKLTASEKQAILEALNRQ